MKLTKLQRHTAYILMSAEIGAACQIWGFCVWIEKLFGIKEGFHNSETIIKKHFPELWGKRPEKPYQAENEQQGCVWFDYLDKKSNTKRVELLKQCIAETA